MEPTSILDPNLVAQTSGVLEFALAYLTSLPSLIMAGDVGAIFVAAIGGYVALWVMNKVSSVMLFLFKKLVGFVIVGVAFYFVVMMFLEKVGTADPVVFILGIVGIIIGFFVVVLALFSLLKHTAKTTRMVRKVTGAPAAAYLKEGEEPVKIVVPQVKKEVVEQKNIITDHNDMLVLVGYILVAQFGVFSSKTISAPNPTIGIILAVLVIIGALAFILKNFKDKKRGFTILAVVLGASIILSFVLGNVWAAFPWEELLSLQYFESDALVAFVTGTAVSLFMGSKAQV